MSIDPRTGVGEVALTVRDLERVQVFYERTVGLAVLSTEPGRVVLGAGSEPLVELVADPDARPRTRRTTGLYHLAILVPDRRELARSLRRVIDARWRLVGAADHLVSEALYLEDPEGNGIEIYRDRPRDRWRRHGDELAMATLPLDLQDVMAELAPDDDTDGHLEGIAPGARMGHVHLHVADLADAERFYGGLIGFDVTARGYPGALFMSAGGYHHHLGLNVWAGQGAPPPPSGSTGLRRFEILVEEARELDEIAGRLDGGGVSVERRGDGLETRDPSQNPLVLRTRT